jgi:hypothetical protein
MYFYDKLNFITLLHLRLSGIKDQTTSSSFEESSSSENSKKVIFFMYSLVCTY